MARCLRTWNAQHEELPNGGDLMYGESIKKDTSRATSGYSGTSRDQRSA